MNLPNIIQKFASLAAGQTTGKVRTPRRSALSLLMQQNISAAKKDLGQYRKALQMAEKVESPRQYQLMAVYKEAWLDPHLRGEVLNRKEKILQSRFNVYTPSGEADEQLTWLLKKTWFRKLAGLMLDARFWGHSLVQIDGVTPLQNGAGGIVDVSLVPREHISPREGLLLARPTDPKGIDYRNEPTFKDWIIETPEQDELGLLNPATPQVLYQRFAQATWSEFTELYVTPLRVGKTNVRDTEMLRQMEDMLIRMGSSAFAVIDESETLEFIQAAQNDGQVFERLMNKCEAKISKVITGTVIGNATQGGSRSKEEVGERSFNDVVESDKEWLQNIINDRLFPLLIAHGYPLQGCTFEWEEQKDLKQLWDMTHQSMMYYHVDEEWVKNTFGIEVTGKKETPGLPGQLNQLPFFD